MRKGIVKRDLRLKYQRKPLADMTIEEKKVMVCATCGAAFPEYLDSCPECGGTERKGFAEDRARFHSRTEPVLAICGHASWFLGLLGGIILFWQTGDDNEFTDLFILFGFILMTGGGFLAAAYFGLAELLSRIMHVEAPLRAELYKTLFENQRRHKKDHKD